MASSPAVAASYSSFPAFSPGNAKQAVFEHLAETPRLARVTAASHLEIRPAPDTVSFGIAELDALTGGLPRGCLTEIIGPDSSGRTSVLLATLAAATRRGEICALIDATDSFHPHSAVAAGIDLTRLLWVRCTAAASSSKNIGSSTSTPRSNSTIASAKLRNSLKCSPGTSRLARTREPRASRQLRESRDGYVSVQTHLTTDAHGVRNFFQASSGSGMRPALTGNEISTQPDLFSQEDPLTRWKRRKMEDPVEQALRATDLLLQSGGFGLVVIDLAGVPVKTARRIPLTTWFRFRRVIEATPTILLLIGEQPCAQTCASLGLRMAGQNLPSVVVGSEFTSQHSTISTYSNPLMDSLSFPAPSFGARKLFFFEGEQKTVRRIAPDPSLGVQSSQPETGLPSHAHLLEGLHLQIELVRLRTERKPAQSVTDFPAKTVWADIPAQFRSSEPNCPEPRA